MLKSFFVYFWALTFSFLAKASPICSPSGDTFNTAVETYINVCKANYDANHCAERKQKEGDDAVDEYKKNAPKTEREIQAALEKQQASGKTGPVVRSEKEVRDEVNGRFATCDASEFNERASKTVEACTQVVWADVKSTVVEFPQAVIKAAQDNAACSRDIEKKKDMVAKINAQLGPGYLFSVTDDVSTLPEFPGPSEEELKQNPYDNSMAARKQAFLTPQAFKKISCAQLLAKLQNHYNSMLGLMKKYRPDDYEKKFGGEQETPTSPHLMQLMVKFRDEFGAWETCYNTAEVAKMNCEIILGMMSTPPLLWPVKIFSMLRRLGIPLAKFIAKAREFGVVIDKATEESLRAAAKGPAPSVASRVDGTATSSVGQGIVPRRPGNALGVKGDPPPVAKASAPQSLKTSTAGSGNAGLHTMSSDPQVEAFRALARKGDVKDPVPVSYLDKDGLRNYGQATIENGKVVFTNKQGHVVLSDNEAMTVSLSPAQVEASHQVSSVPVRKAPVREPVPQAADPYASGTPVIFQPTRVPTSRPAAAPPELRAAPPEPPTGGDAGQTHVLLVAPADSQARPPISTSVTSGRSPPRVNNTVVIKRPAPPAEKPVPPTLQQREVQSLTQLKNNANDLLSVRAEQRELQGGLHEIEKLQLDRISNLQSLANYNPERAKAALEKYGLNEKYAEKFKEFNGRLRYQTWIDIRTDLMKKATELEEKEAWLTASFNQKIQRGRGETPAGRILRGDGMPQKAQTPEEVLPYLNSRLEVAQQMTPVAPRQLISGGGRPITPQRKLSTKPPQYRRTETGSPRGPQHRATPQDENFAHRFDQAVKKIAGDRDISTLNISERKALIDEVNKMMASQGIRSREALLRQGDKIDRGVMNDGTSSDIAALKANWKKFIKLDIDSNHIKTEYGTVAQIRETASKMSNQALTQGNPENADRAVRGFASHLPRTTPDQVPYGQLILDEHKDLLTIAPRSPDSLRKMYQDHFRTDLENGGVSQQKLDTAMRLFNVDPVTAAKKIEKLEQSNPQGAVALKQDIDGLYRAAVSVWDATDPELRVKALANPNSIRVSPRGVPESPVDAIKLLYQRILAVGHDQNPSVLDPRNRPPIQESGRARGGQQRGMEGGYRNSVNEERTYRAGGYP